MLAKAICVLQRMRSSNFLSCLPNKHLCEAVKLLFVGVLTLKIC
jgi:hypothetical protein